MIFDAAEFATGFLSVAQAFAKDKLRPQLNRTVLVEEYRHGVRLVAVDGFLLLTSWVRYMGADGLDPATAEPGLDELPERQSVVHDPDGRGRQLLHWARNLAARRDKEDEERPKLRVEIGMLDGPGVSVAAQAFEGLEPKWCRFKLDAEEEVRIQLYEGDYIDWRQIVAAVEYGEAEQFLLPSWVLEQIAKVAGLHSDHPWRWSMSGGDEDPMRIELQFASPSVWGCVMPAGMNRDSDPDGEVEGQQSTDGLAEVIRIGRDGE